MTAHAAAPSASAKSDAPLPGGGFLVTPVPRKIFVREHMSEDAELFLDTARKFWNEQVLAQVEAIENKEMVEVDGEKVPLAIKLLRDAAELGLLALDIDEDYGGLGLDKVTSFLVAEAFAGCASQAATCGAHAGIGTLPIAYFGTEEQKQKYVTKLASGELIGCYALTEPGSGSDALSGKTTARLSEDGTHYLITGEKLYITNGGWADLAVVFARLDGEYTGFIVDLHQPGVSRGAEEKKMGIHGSSTTSLIFEDAKVPLEDMLGEPGDAAKIALNILYVGRLKLGVGDLGTSKYAIDLTVKFGKERKQFGQPVITFGMQKAKLADMVTRTFALDSLCYRVIGEIDDEVAKLEHDESYDRNLINVLRRFGVESAIIKFHGSETLMRIVNHAVRMHGGYGFCREYQVERLLRDNVIDTIFEGTNDINRMVCFGETVRAIYSSKIPFREYLEGIHRDLREGTMRVPAEPSALADLETRVIALKRGLAYVMERALIGVGKDVRVRQQVMSRMADALCHLLAADSTMARALVLFGAGDLPPARREVIRAITELVIHETLAVVTAVGGEVLANTTKGELLGQCSDELDRLLAGARVPTDVYALRELVADHTIEVGKYDL